MNRITEENSAGGGGLDPLSLMATAEETARTCGALLLKAYRQPKGDYEEKSPGDLVSEVDRNSQALAREMLLRATPEAVFLAEEGSDSCGDVEDPGSLIWIVDPLDGTANFLHRFPAFAVSVAVARGRELLAGAVFVPMTGECFTAAAGHGAMLDGEPIGVSKESDLSRGLIATGWPFRRKEVLDVYMEVFKRIFWASQGIRRNGSAAIDLAYTASGRLEGFWEYGLSIWDTAAGALLVREAGGRVTDFGGGEGWWDSGDIVATNGGIHDALLEAAATPNGISDIKASC